MALNTKPPVKPAEDDAAFERAISKAPDQKGREMPALSGSKKPHTPGKPGRKAGAAYGLGIPAGDGRRQLTVTFPTEMLERLNRAAERTHQPRASLILLAIQKLLDEPTFRDPT